MLCGYPIKLGDKYVPCNQCMNCRINKHRFWTGRIILEATYAPIESSFITLTYNDEHLPADGSLRPWEVQEWLKRIRHRTGIGMCRFFAVGEYGDKTTRPHYHAALFGVPPTEDWQQKIRQCWRKDDQEIGYTSIGLIEPKSASYIAGYTKKKLTRPDDIRLDGRQPEFARMSKSPPLGYAGIKKIISTLETKNGSRLLAAKEDVPETFRIFGKEYPIGKYWRDYMRDHFHIHEVPKSAPWAMELSISKEQRANAKAHAQKRFRQRKQNTRNL